MGRDSVGRGVLGPKMVFVTNGVFFMGEKSEKGYNFSKINVAIVYS